MDLDVVKDAGLDTTIPMVVANTDDFADIKVAAQGEKKAGEAAFYCVAK